MTSIIPLYPMVKWMNGYLSATLVGDSAVKTAHLLVNSAIRSNTKKHPAFLSMTSHLFDCTFTQQNEHIFKICHMLLNAWNASPCLEVELREKTTSTWYLTRHLLQAASHFTRIAKYPRPFNIYQSAVQLTHYIPLYSSSQLSSKQIASRKTQHPDCLCVCIYFSYWNEDDRQVYILFLPVSLLWLLTKTTKPFVLKGHDK